MTDNPLSGKVTLDTTDYKTGVAELTRQVKLIESGFKATAAGMEDWSKTSGGLEARIKALTSVLELQQRKIQLLQDAYKQIVATKGAESKAAQDMQLRINRETEALNKNKLELSQCQKSLDNFGKASVTAGKEAEQVGQKAQKGAAGLDEMAKGAKETLEKLFAFGLGVETVRLGIEKLKDFIREANEEFLAEARVNAQLEQVIRSTGGAADVSAAQIRSMGLEIEKLTGVIHDDTMKAAALMLTFTKVSSQIFPDAIKASEDISAVLGQDLQSSIVQIGKALNDPITGMTALRRVGVSFTQQQVDQVKAMIAANNLLGAQKLILKELQTEFGGAAEAIYQVDDGSIKLTNDMSAFKELVGGKLMPQQRAWNRLLDDYINQWIKVLTTVEDLRAALNDEGDAAARNAGSYIEYQESMKKAAEEQGLLLKNGNELYRMMSSHGHLIPQLVDANYMLTESQWKVLQYWKDSKEAIQQLRLEEQRAGVDTSGLIDVDADLASQTNDLAQSQKDLDQAQWDVHGSAQAVGSAQLDNASASAAADAAVNDLITAEKKLATAQGDLTKAQENWTKGAGNDAQNALEKAGVKGKKMSDALGIIDQVMGTSLLTQANYNKALQDAAEEYQKTGDLEKYREKLDYIKDGFEPLDQSIKDATTDLGLMKDAVDALKSKIITITTVHRDVYEGTGSSTGSTAAPSSPMPTTDPGDGYEWVWNGFSWVKHKVKGFSAGIVDFIVPPGYKNDSFPMRVSSGEHVTVIPPNLGLLRGLAGNLNQISAPSPAPARAMAPGSQKLDVTVHITGGTGKEKEQARAGVLEAARAVGML
jgi:hypothetical protein